MNDQIDLAPTRPRPPVTVQLRDGWRACRCCGVATMLDDDHGPEAVKRLVSFRGHPEAVHAMPTQYAELVFTTCSECADRHRRAEEMARRLPRLMGVVGHPVADHLTPALDAYAAAGLWLPETERMNYGDAAMMARVLAFIGSSVQYANHATRDDEANDSSWRHLDHELRERLRTTHARLLARRVALSAPPVTVPCPEGRGCLFCGVDALTLAAVDVHDLGGSTLAADRLWHPRSANAAVLGGGSQAASIRGHVCPPCAEAIQDAGAIGPGALARSYVGHLKETGADTSDFWGWQDDDVLDGLRAWSVIGTDTPSATRWEHVGRLVQR